LDGVDEGPGGEWERKMQDGFVRMEEVARSEGLAELFDTTVISGEVATRKPEPEIYRLAAARLGVACEQCVFVDDFRVNVEGSEAVGMTGLLHRKAAPTIDRLEQLLEVRLR
jgi:FMN phosphatase YigB (HAD superfamily)